jgi:hypothetical protein
MGYPPTQTAVYADQDPLARLAARELAPPPPPKSAQPPGIPMSDMTMDEFMDIEDGWSTRRDRV